MLQFSAIDNRRSAAGIAQKALAERAGMKPQDYSRLKRPSPRGPTTRTLQKLGEALEALVAEKEGQR